MIDLDTRARSASQALRRTVGEADLVLVEPPSVRERVLRPRSPMLAMAAGAVTALVLLLGIWSLRPTVVAEDLEVTTTTVTEITSTTGVTPTTAATSTVSAPMPAAPSPTVAIDTRPPAIAIVTPHDGQVFEAARITFAGTTEPGARVFGGPYEATVDEAGNWSIVLILSEGPNRAVFRAVDAAGNESTAEVTAVFAPPVKSTPPPKQPEKDPAAFVAFATWLESANLPAYDEYYGTGEPGSTVKVVSEWGSGETLVKSDGSWYLKVFYPDAPKGLTFEVKVKDTLGRYTYFPMTATG